MDSLSKIANVREDIIKKFRDILLVDYAYKNKKEYILKADDQNKTAT